MEPRSEFSWQTLSVLAVLCEQPSEWRHLARRTGLKSGTLYPILVRLADCGLMEARWHEGQPAGRPRRHLYRLTPDGLAQASVAVTGGAPAAKPPPRTPVRAAPPPRRGVPAQA